MSSIGERVASLEATAATLKEDVGEQELRDSIHTTCIRNIERQVLQIKWLAAGLGFGLTVKTIAEIFGYIGGGS